MPVNPALSPSPFLDGDSAERLSWWPQHHLDSVARTAQGAWSAWMRDWIPAAVSVSDGVTCGLAHDSLGLAELQWEPLGGRGRAAAWIEVRQRPVDKIQEALFGADRLPAPLGPREGVAPAVAAQAWSALICTLREALCLDCDGGQPSPARGIFKPWSGYVLVSPPGGVPLAQSLLLNAECVHALIGLPGRPGGDGAPQSSVGTSSLEEALAGHSLLIRAELAGCELDLGELENLRIGDIVSLAHALDEPLLVSTPDDVPFCAGFLGRHAGSKAIELIRPAPVQGARQFDHYPQEVP
jgi:hypothetical protein